jgi:hypothetical protein
VKTILNRLFSRAQTPRLTLAVQRFQHLYAPNAKFTLDTLTFVPNYGGYNTRSLIANRNAYSGKNGIDYYTDVLLPKYGLYKKDAAARNYQPFSFDEWLQWYHENYETKEQRSLPK